jgi:hypothetical protein
VLSGTLQPQGDVPGWGDRTFYRADFSLSNRPVTRWLLK